MASGMGGAGLLGLFLFAMFGWEVVKAFRTGIMQTLTRGKSIAVDRREHPTRFFFEVLWGVVLSVGMLCWGIYMLYSAHHLPPGNPARTITEYIMPKGPQM